jgi:7-carboxy-7-deazaguanine synthase
MSREEIHEEVDRAGLPYVCLTGGEPLLQEELPVFAAELLAKGLVVSVETGGHMDISRIPDGVHRILDLKTPGAFGRPAQPATTAPEILAQTEFCSANLEHLSQDDEVKIVINDLKELPWVDAALRVLRLTDRVRAVHLSPVHGTIDLPTLAAWIVQTKHPVRLHLQVHKLVFGAEATGV